MKKCSLLAAVLILLVTFSACESNSSTRTSTVPAPKVSTDSAYLYHSDSRIDQLISRYNQVAEYPISSDMVSNGAYDSRANISCNDVYIMITASDTNGIFVDYQIEAKDDSAIKPLFRDFCRSLNSDINDNDINSAWNALQTEKYQNYNNYKLKTIECTYSASMPLSNGLYNFTVKTNAK